VKVSELRHGDYFIRLWGEVVIYCQVSEHTEYSEDTPVIEERRKYGFVFGKCYSVLCPEGEYGDTSVGDIKAKITPETFERARLNGWRTLQAVN
jgi:hypothetical protein